MRELIHLHESLMLLPDEEMASRVEIKQELDALNTLIDRSKNENLGMGRSFDELCAAYRTLMWVLNPKAYTFTSEGI